MPLTNADIVELTDFRHALHRQPEVSGHEAQTARTIAAALPAPDALVTGLGGHGIAAVYDSGRPGPTVMIRSELDALPILELGTVPHASEIPGVGHLCGHDGHSTILMGLARLL
ncbi:MAG: amidohydrolase, partial [Rhodobacteraceae bacterium]|nr:amidohydrolase [Paracoccaceae bacterium]